MSTPLHRLLALVLAAAGLAACLPRKEYAGCKVDADCRVAGAVGHCETSGASAGQCVAGPPGDPDASTGPDAMTIDPPDAPVSGQGLECVKGGKRTAEGTCAQSVCAAEPRCCTEAWSEVCVKMTETLCKRSCSTMAFVGGGYGVVVDTATWQGLWTDRKPDGNASDSATKSGRWADYNGDGKEDLATAGDDLLRIYRNDGFDGTHLVLTPVFVKHWSSLVASGRTLGGRAVAWGDWSGDGHLDLAFAGGDGLVLVKNDGGDTFVTDEILIQTPDPQAPQPQAPGLLDVAFADADGDGDLDLVTGGGIKLTYFANSGGKLTKTAFAGDQNVEGVSWCNLDKDPAPELVVASSTAIDIYDDASKDGPGAVTHVDSGAWFVRIYCGDLDGDKDLDLWANTWGGQARAVRNGANSVDSFATAWTDPATPNTWGYGLGDLDGDGKLDAVMSGNAFAGTFTLRPYKNTSTGTSQNINFAAQAIPTVKLDGVAIDDASYDLNLGSLPAKGN